MVVNIGVTMASRQKNCNTCVQAKRRCDRRTPVCSRCTDKNLSCVYSESRSRPSGGGRAGKYARAPARSIAAHTETTSIDDPTYSSPFDMPGLSFDTADFLEDVPDGFLPDFFVEPTFHSIRDAGAVSGGDTPTTDSFISFLDNNIISSSSNQGLSEIEKNHHHLPLERPTTPADKEVLMSMQEMNTCNLDTWDMYDPTTSLHYIVERTKGFTGDMAKRNATPFIHRFLYQSYTSQCLVSCFTICALYESRTSVNKAMAMRALSNGARELVDTEVGHVGCSPIEKLARCQALFLYQIIRLFDGDISLRAQGEKDMTVFKTWLAELCHIRDNLGGLARLNSSSVREQSPMEWGKWIFAECVRRTIIISYATIGLYDLLRDPDYTPNTDNPLYLAHRWTLGRSLWEANSATEFQRAWSQGRHFVVTSFAFNRFVDHGRADDVDEFAEVLLTVYLGNEEMKEFMQREKSTQGIA